MMSSLVLVLAFLAMFSQAYSANLSDSLVNPYAALLQENIASYQLQQQINSSIGSIITNMGSYDIFVRNLTDQTLAEYQKSIQEKVSNFKWKANRLQKRSLTIPSGTSVIFKCVIEEGKLDVLGNTVNEELKKCATVAMAEMVNVISDSVNEAQTFMSLPRIIGRDVQRCGLSSNCRWDIVNDAISEAIQVPPKVYALAAKIQSIALRTVVSVDSCGLRALRQITESAVGLLENIFLCISNVTESSLISQGGNNC